MNICGEVAECGKDQGKPVAGCELDHDLVVGPVGVERSLQYSTDGLLTLTYKGDLDRPTGTVNGPSYLQSTRLLPST